MAAELAAHHRFVGDPAIADQVLPSFVVRGGRQDRDRDQTRDTGHEALMNGIRAQGGADRPFFLILHSRRQ